MAFSHAAQDVDDRSRQQIEVSGVQLQIALYEAPEQAVEDPGAALLEPALPLSLDAASVDDVVTRLLRLQHLRRERGWILQVGVHHDHRVAHGVIESCGDGKLVAEVARETD